MSLWNRLVNGLNGFREGFLNADPQQQRNRALGWFDEFSLWEARQLRYELFWAFYQANTFRKKIHLWAPELKAEFGLYRDTRNVYNPVHRLVEFGVTHTWGGVLDPAAGDGQKVRSAIPIETKHEYLRPAIAKLWQDSKWQIKKAVATRWGVCLGDVALRAVDDPERGTVIIRPEHPGKYKWIKRDSRGEIVQYIFEEERYDPRSPNTANINPVIDPRSMLNTAIYTEEATVENGEVTYKTYLDGALYDWRGNGRLDPVWTAPYPFIPLEIVNHKDVGLPWGMAECHSLISKVFEVDDMASGLGDQIRKAIRAPKLVTGVKVKADGSLDITYPQSSDALGDGSTNPSPSRQSSAIFTTTNENAKVHDLTFPLDIAGVNEHIKSINEEIERDYPELQIDIWATGDPSGRALRVARQRSEEKVQERRPAYDSGLVAIQRKALAIAGIRGYVGFEALATTEPNDPKLDHSVGHRPVFQPDPLDDIEEGQAFWAMVKQAVDAGMPLEIVLEREGWDPADIAKITAQKDANAAKAMDNIKAKQKLAMADVPPGGAND